MKATVYFALSTEGQRDALRRNLPAAKWQTLEGDIEENDLAMFSISESGEAYLLTETAYSGNPVVPQAYLGTSPYCSLDRLDRYPDTIREILDVIAQRPATEKAKAEAQKKQQIADTLATLETEYAKALANPDYSLPECTRYFSAPEIDQHPIWQLRRERMAAKEIRAEQARQQQEAKEAAKVAYIAQWIRANGDEPMRARHADGLLSRETAIDAIATAAFSPIGPKLSYRVCQDRNHECRISDIASLDAASYAKWVVLRAALPEGSTWEFSEIVPCLRDAESEQCSGEDGEDIGEKIIAVNVTIPCGPFHFSRMLAL